MHTKSKMCSVSHLLVTCLTFGAGISGVCSSHQSSSLSHHINDSHLQQLALTRKIQVSFLLTCHFVTSHVQTEVKVNTGSSVHFPLGYSCFLPLAENSCGVCALQLWWRLLKGFFIKYAGVHGANLPVLLNSGLVSSQLREGSDLQGFLVSIAVIGERHLPRTICLILRWLSKRSGIISESLILVLPAAEQAYTRV